MRNLQTVYKNAEVSLIPNDWEVFVLADIAKVIDSLHRTPDFSKDGYPMVRVTDIKEGDLCLNGALKVSKVIFEEFTKNCLPKKNDIVMSRVGSYGVSSFVNTDSLFCLGQNTVILQPKVQARFLYYAITSFSVIHQIEDGSYGSGYKSLSLKNIRELRIALPPTNDEQLAIATALSDVDALITSLDKLIAKKRDIKQATMQQLLTGRTRLPGFSGRWEVKCLGAILNYVQPSKYLVRDTGYNEFFDTPVLTAGKTFILGYTSERDGIFSNVPVIIFDDFTTESKFVDFPFKAKSSAMKMLKTRNDDERLRFVFDRMQMIKFQLGDHKRYWISEFQKLSIEVPKSEEQAAICTYLSDMTSEITALEQRRDKTKLLKQGMMQELLTGRIRLV